MDEEQNDLWLEEESEENAEEIPWAESILDFADWNQDEDAPVCDEELEEALAEERNVALESELEQDEHPLEAEDDIPEDAETSLRVNSKLFRHLFNLVANKFVSKAIKLDIRLFYKDRGLFDKR